MEYRAVNGQVYWRHALTPPIVNSEKSQGIGLMASTSIDLQSGGNVQLKEGSNVKIRLLLDNQTKRMTCHAQIDCVSKDDATGKYTVSFGSLSLSDAEFEILEKYLLDRGEATAEFVDQVRKRGEQAAPVTLVETAREAVRAKAVTMPVTLIERIDAKRGNVPFSEFVVRAVKAYLNE